MRMLKNFKLLVFSTFFLSSFGIALAGINSDDIYQRALQIAIVPGGLGMNEDQGIEFAKSFLDGTKDSSLIEAYESIFRSVEKVANFFFQCSPEKDLKTIRRYNKALDCESFRRNYDYTLNDGRVLAETLSKLPNFASRGKLFEEAVQLRLRLSPPVPAITQINARVKANRRASAKTFYPVTSMNFQFSASTYFQSETLIVNFWDDVQKFKDFAVRCETAVRYVEPSSTNAAIFERIANRCNIPNLTNLEFVSGIPADPACSTKFIEYVEEIRTQSPIKMIKEKAIFIAAMSLKNGKKNLNCGSPSSETEPFSK